MGVLEGSKESSELEQELQVGGVETHYSDIAPGVRPPEDGAEVQLEFGDSASDKGGKVPGDVYSRRVPLLIFIVACARQNDELDDASGLDSRHILHSPVQVTPDEFRDQHLDQGFVWINVRDLLKVAGVRGDLEVLNLGVKGKILTEFIFRFKNCFGDRFSDVLPRGQDRGLEQDGVGLS